MHLANTVRQLHCAVTVWAGKWWVQILKTYHRSLDKWLFSSYTPHLHSEGNKIFSDITAKTLDGCKQIIPVILISGQMGNICFQFSQNAQGFFAEFQLGVREEGRRWLAWFHSQWWWLRALPAAGSSGSMSLQDPRHSGTCSPPKSSWLWTGFSLPLLNEHTKFLTFLCLCIVPIWVSLVIQDRNS